MPIQIIRLISDWYSNQSVRVRWAGGYSEAFGVSNGVRQGSVLSPVLFNVMMDGLLRQVQKTGYGAKMAGFYVGCLAYADDMSR